MKEKLIGADALRALACLWVFIYHAFLNLDRPVEGLAYRLAEAGQKGVSVFFVLSGMLLSIPFWKAYHADQALPSIKTYAIHRLARIIPAYYICLLLLFVIENNRTFSEVVELLSGLTFTNSFHWRTFFPVHNNVPLWTIGVEMVFYVLLVFGMMGLFKLRGKIPVLVYWAAILALLVTGQMILTNHFPLLHETIQVPNDERYQLAITWLPRRNPFGLFTHFLLGVLAASLYLQLTQRFLDRKQNASGFAAKHLFDFLALFLLILIFLEAEEKTIKAAPFIWRLFAPEYYGIRIDYHWPVFPFLIAALLLALPFSNKIGPWLDNRFLCWTAKLSYGIYLWHSPLFKLFELYFKDIRGAGPARMILYMLTVLAASYLAAALSYYLIEKPVMNLAYKFRPRGALVVPARST